MFLKIVKITNWRRVVVTKVQLHDGKGLAIKYHPVERDVVLVLKPF